MNHIQIIIVLLWGIYSFIAFFLGWRHRKNPFGLSRWFLPLGAFVWTDTIVFGLFFFLVSAFCLVTNQFILFLLIFSVFWTIRSVGEQVYWFLEQFAVAHKNAPHTLWPKKWFKGQESWIVMQITWQCVSAIFIVLSAYLLFTWFRTVT